MSDQILDQQMDTLIQGLSFPLSTIELMEQAESAGLDDEFLMLLSL